MPTYAKMCEQIAKLEAEAEQLKIRERIGVIAQVRDAIDRYSITMEELTAPNLPEDITAEPGTAAGASPTELLEVLAKGSKRSHHKKQSS